MEAGGGSLPSHSSGQVPEDFIFPILDSFLRGSSLNSSFEAFYKNSSPAFKNFKVGREYTMQMASIHREYCDTLEALLSKRLEEIGSSFGRFEDVFESSLEEAKEGSDGVRGALERAGDFEEFAKMMQGRYENFYGAYEEGGDEDVESEQYYLRILWDIENVSIPRGVSGFSFASNLISHCEEAFRGCKGTDTLCTAFHCPSKRSFSDADGRGLDRACVEQVLVQMKREDADRKINGRLNREMRLLPPERTCFVLVTSDLDFVATMKELRGRGFTVGNLHRARGFEQARALGGHADWSDHINIVEARVGSGGEGEEEKEEEEEEEKEEKEDGKNKKKNKGSNKNARNSKKVVPLGRNSGTVQFWAHGGWGFIKVGGGGRVFVHNLSLPKDAKRRYLVVGEEVEFDVVEGNEKGPKAENVVAIGGGMLICQASNEDNGSRGRSNRRKN